MLYDSYHKEEIKKNSNELNDNEMRLQCEFEPMRNTFGTHEIQKKKCDEKNLKPVIKSIKTNMNKEINPPLLLSHTFMHVCG